TEATHGVRARRRSPRLVDRHALPVWLRRNNPSKRARWHEATLADETPSRWERHAAPFSLAEFWVSEPLPFAGRSYRVVPWFRRAGYRPENARTQFTEPSPAQKTHIRGRTMSVLRVLQFRVELQDIQPAIMAPHPGARRLH